MKKFFEAIKEPLKVTGFFILVSITVVFGAWLTMILFNYAPVFKQIGEALGISGLAPKDWCLGFLAYILYKNGKKNATSSVWHMNCHNSF